MKKIMCVIVVMLLVLSCVGCTTTKEIVVEEETEASVDGTTASETLETTDVTAEKTTAQKTTVKTTENTKYTTIKSLGTLCSTKTHTTRSRKTATREEEQQRVELTVLSFNVRYKDDANGHSIAQRAPRVEATVDAHAPDIIGLQEVVPAWDTQLKQRFSDDYEILTHYRSNKNPEGLSILYKKDMFTLQDEGFFWLSETPDVESKGWGASLPRIATWALLKHRESGKEILFFCYHGEWISTFASKSCLLIVEKAKAYPDAATMIVGDFNVSNTSSGFATFTEYFADVRTTASETGYNHAEGSCPKGYPDPKAADGDKENNVIDHMLCDRESMYAVAFQFDRTRYDGYYASDHYAAIGKVIVK